MWLTAPHGLSRLPGGGNTTWASIVRPLLAAIGTGRIGERRGDVAVADWVPHHLSFGERRRAGVLACDPSVLVLDEPTANLDPRGRRRFMNLIRALPATKLIATHDLEMALELCGRVVLIDGGKVVADGPSREVLGNPALVDAHGLELPLSMRLAR